MDNNLKVGILTEHQFFERHENWQKYLIKQIADGDSIASVKFICINALLDKQQKTESFAACIFDMQLKLEKKLNRIKIPNVQSPDSKIDTINVSCDIESLIANRDNDLYKCEFDIIINISNVHITPNLAQLAKKGVWELQYLHHNINNEYFGLFEILNNKPNIVISIVNYLPDSTRKTCAAKFNIHFSVYKNRIYILYGITSSLLKYIVNGDSLVSDKDSACVKYEIKPFDIARYLMKFYKELFSKFTYSISNKILRNHIERWRVLLGQGTIMDNDLKLLTKINPPAKEFWADPFVFKNDNSLYLFFERFSFSTLRGRISCCKIESGMPVEVTDVLSLDYHLSYPYIFRENDDIFMIPETSERKRLEVYRCIEFPDKWELYSTAFDGISMADTVYYKDKDGQQWLFSSLSHPIIHDHCTELYIYKIDSLKFNNIEPHRQNPVMTDSSLARNGGGFFENEGKLYRVSQINSYGIYGLGININEIKKMSIESFEEEKVKEILYSDLKDSFGTHHMHQINGLFVLDICYKRK